MKYIFILFLTHKQITINVFNYLKNMLIFPEITAFKVYFRTFVLILLVSMLCYCIPEAIPDLVSIYLSIYLSIIAASLYAIYITKNTPNYLFIDILHKLK